jgi:hypothetical protein
MSLALYVHLEMANFFMDDRIRCLCHFGNVSLQDLTPETDPRDSLPRSVADGHTVGLVLG